MEALEKSGDLTVVAGEVDWDLELGAMGRLACETQSAALWFKRVADYPGWTIFMNPLATWRRVAIALGLPADSPIKMIHREYEAREGRLIPPVTVENGPCKEVVKLGDQVDLFDLPAP